tara:strand:+ start:339 stop:716 length:378 start_codon:yes stop_codon:yes gene_type:complete
MPIATISLNFENINISAQVGDIIYYTIFSGNSQGGFNQAGLANTVMLGPIIDITTLGDDTFNITVKYNNSTTSPPSQGDFISFVKDKKVNTSSLLGYYASVNFVNNSTDKIELFSVGSEVTESSK